jgi:hypothetical protein
MDGHALDFGVVMIDCIYVLCARGRTEDIGGMQGRGMEVAEVEKEGDG